MDHINLFQTNAEFLSAYNGSDYIEPWLSYTMETSGVAYNKREEPHDYSQDYLTFVMLQDDTTLGTNYDGDAILFSTNNGETWSSEEITDLNTGDKVLVKGNRPVFLGSTTTPFYIDKNFNVEGNIMSLIYGDNFRNQTELPPYDPEGEHWHGEFLGVFYGCSTLISAEHLILPATALTQSCYTQMFLTCSSLITPPTLPATTLAEGCYSEMFVDCASLTTAPELPATTLAEGCYSEMFENCTGLTTAPELPATTLADGCYRGMFDRCTNLNYIKCLATDISASNCTYNWVYGVAANGTFVKDANMSSWTTGVNGIPSNWTVQNA